MVLNILAGIFFLQSRWSFVHRNCFQNFFVLWIFKHFIFISPICIYLRYGIYFLKIIPPRFQTFVLFISLSVYFYIVFLPASPLLSPKFLIWKIWKAKWMKVWSTVVPRIFFSSFFKIIIAEERFQTYVFNFFVSTLYFSLWIQIKNERNRWNFYDRYFFARFCS